MKYFHYFLAVIFLLFAIVQYNDPDAFIWMPVYGATSFLALSYGLGRPQKRIAILLSIVLIIWAATYVPDLITWLRDGTPNIAGSMKAESPHIELMREMFGLLLCLLVSGWYALKR